MVPQLAALVCVSLLEAAGSTACSDDVSTARGSDQPDPETALEIPLGATATIDGLLETAEWDDAELIELTIGSAVQVVIRFKHDGTSLLLAMVYDRKGGTGHAHPEVYIDTENDKSEEWRADDWWFHVSATDCEAQGTYDPGPEACQLVQPGWEAERNPRPPDWIPVDTTEIRIPFAKIGIAVGDRIGMAFNVHYHDGDQIQEGFWPSLAVMERPSTWGIADIQ